MSDTSPSITYEGQRLETDTVIHRLPDNTVLSPTSTQLRNRNVTQFEWGYLGTGVAQLAFALINDYYGSERLARAYHQSLKRDLLATIPHQASRWRLPGSTIEHFVEPYREDDLSTPSISSSSKNAQAP